MRLEDLTLDDLWRDIVAVVKPGDIVPTLKCRASAEVVSVGSDRITILLNNGETREIRKSYYGTVLARLREQGRVRQLNVPGNTERYVLGILKLLPYFKAVKEYDPSEGKEKHFIRFTGESLAP